MANQEANCSCTHEATHYEFVAIASRSQFRNRYPSNSRSCCRTRDGCKKVYTLKYLHVKVAQAIAERRRWAGKQIFG